MGERARRGLPPVPVHCNRCGEDFSSRARDKTVVRCTLCGHANRVKRAGNMYADDQPVYADPAPSHTSGAFPAPVPAAAPVQVAGHAADNNCDPDDDGETYVYDERGQLVLGEWTDDGRLVPAQLPPARQAAELAARGYRENPAAAPGGCHITETAPAVQACALAAETVFGGLPVCGPHHHALTASLRKTASPHT